MKRLFNKDVPFITYIIHNKNMENGRTVTVYEPTQEYYILFELIKFRRLPSTFPDIGITVISEGSEPSLSDVSMTQDVSIDIKTPPSIENTNPDYYKQELARRDEIIARLKDAGNELYLKGCRNYLPLGDADWAWCALMKELEESENE